MRIRDEKVTMVVGNQANAWYHYSELIIVMIREEVIMTSSRILLAYIQSVS